MSDQITGMRPTPGVLGDLEAWIEFDPGTGPYSSEMRWYLRGPGLAVQFVVFLGWGEPGERMFGPCSLSADLGYHSDRPLYSGQEQHDCTALPGGFCHNGRSGLEADKALALLIEQGDATVWSYLAEYLSGILRERDKA